MILGFLMSGPKTGYRLKAISGKLIMFYSITLNKIYPVLRKLEENGYIGKEIIFQTGKPNKHLYSLTPSGKTYFLEKLKGPPAPIDLADPFLIKAFFFRFLDKTEIKTEFEKEIHNIEETLGDLALLEDTVAEQADDYGQFIYRTAVKLFGTMQNLYTEELSKM